MLTLCRVTSLTLYLYPCYGIIALTGPALVRGRQSGRAHVGQQP